MWEKELLGLYISHHPLSEYQAYLSDNFTPIKNITPDMEGNKVTVAGITTTIRRIITKNNDAMAFVGLEDLEGDLELIVFPKSYERTRDLWVEDQIIAVTGKVSTKDRDGKTGTEIKILVDEAAPIDTREAKKYSQGASPTASGNGPKKMISAAYARAVNINLQDLTDTVGLMRIKDVLSRYGGEAEAYVVIGGEQPKKIRLPYKVSASAELLKRLSAIVGEGMIQVESS